TLYCALHAFIVSLFLVAALLNDSWAKRLRIIGAVAIPLAALFGLLFNDALFATVPRSADVAYASVLAIISIVYWCRTAMITNLLGAITTVTTAGLLQGRELLIVATQTFSMTGWPWVAWGMLFLLIAASISFWKGGAKVLIRQRLIRLNE